MLEEHVWHGFLAPCSSSSYNNSNRIVHMSHFFLFFFEMNVESKEATICGSPDSSSFSSVARNRSPKKPGQMGLKWFRLYNCSGCYSWLRASSTAINSCGSERHYKTKVKRKSARGEATTQSSPVYMWNYHLGARWSFFFPFSFLLNYCTKSITC